MAKQCSCGGEGSHAGHLAGQFTGRLERPSYAFGLILEDTDLTAAVDYTRSLSRLLFGSLLGCGVICGLTVDVDMDCGLTVNVRPGLGLDGCGDPVHLTQTAQFKLGRRDGVPETPDERKAGPRVRDFWVIACAGEKRCEPRALMCDEDSLDGAKAATRLRSTVAIEIVSKAPDCVCGCATGASATWPEDQEGLDGRARALLRPNPDGGGEYECHEDHERRVECADDCGCGGGGCSCGCCIVLAWIHWVPANSIGKDNPAGWVVLHNGVRRFIRPKLLSDPAARIDLAQSAAIMGDTANEQKETLPLVETSMVNKLQAAPVDETALKEAVAKAIGNNRTPLGKAILARETVIRQELDGAYAKREAALRKSFQEQLDGQVKELRKLIADIQIPNP